MNVSNLQDTGFWAVIDRASHFALINLLWVLLSLPLVTLPAATAGLFAVHSDWVRGKENEPLLRFFGAIRQSWRKATLLGLGTALGLGLVGINVLILAQMNLPAMLLLFSLGVTLGVGWAILATNLYIWAILPDSALSLVDLVKVAAKLAFQHVLWSSVLLIVALILLLFGLWALPMGGVALILFSSVAWMINWGTWRIIRRYEDGDKNE